MNDTRPATISNRSNIESIESFLRWLFLSLAMNLFLFQNSRFLSPCLFVTIGSFKSQYQICAAFPEKKRLRTEMGKRRAFSLRLNPFDIVSIQICSNSSDGRRRPKRETNWIYFPLLSIAFFFKFCRCIKTEYRN